MHKSLLIKGILLLWLQGFFVLSEAHGKDVVTPPPHAANQLLLMDTTTGEVLVEKNADLSMIPSSMTKILTAYVVFMKLREGQLTLDQKLPVSEKAAKTESSWLLREGARTMVSVRDLIKAVIVVSGNDASVVLAEGIAGSEEKFGKLLTEVAHKMGATHTHFLNSSGLPEEGHRTTAKDLAIISLRLMKDFPEYYHLFGESQFVYDNASYDSTNLPLFEKGIGVDGIKTGRTKAAGFGVVASAVQKGRRLLLVLNGLSSNEERAEVSEQMLRWGFAHFDTQLIANKGQLIDHLPVVNGEQEHVAVQPVQDIWVTLPHVAKSKAKALLRFDSPLVAPLVAQQQVAQLVIQVPGREDKVYSLYAAAAIEKANFFRRMYRYIHHVFLGDTFVSKSIQTVGQHNIHESTSQFEG